MFEDVQASTALKRAVTQQSDEHAYQELRKEHDLLTSRLGIDMGEVRVEGEDGQAVDVFGVNVDTAARAMSLVDGGHVCVTPCGSSAGRRPRRRPTGARSSSTSPADGAGRRDPSHGPDPRCVLRVHAGHHSALLDALNSVANQWVSLFW